VPKLAVIGFPVSHSRSPAMQNAALRELGLAPEWSYEAIEAAPEDFETTVRDMAAGGYAGANVTVPHKEAALALADSPDREALAIGAANTLVFKGSQIAATNTDAGGLLAALPGVSSAPAGVKALVLGAGGAARAAIWGLSRAGAVVDVWNRTFERAEAVHAELSERGGKAEYGELVRIGGSPNPDPDQSSYGIVVNTTAVGLRGEDPFEHLPLAADGFAPEQMVVDMVYGERPSPLLAAALAAGATVVDGLEVLVQQGARSLAIWLEREDLPDAVLDAMRAAARAW
jgi:shikimate dehydrogenase